jgi:hypothetical protein
MRTEWETNEESSSMFAVLHNPTIAPLQPEELLALQRPVPQHLLGQGCYSFHTNPFTLPFFPLFLPAFLPSFLSLVLSWGLRPQTPLTITSLLFLAPLSRERYPDTMLVPARGPRAIHQKKLGGTPMTTWLRNPEPLLPQESGFSNIQPKILGLPKGKRALIRAQISTQQEPEPIRCSAKAKPAAAAAYLVWNPRGGQRRASDQTRTRSCGVDAGCSGKHVREAAALHHGQLAGHMG